MYVARQAEQIFLYYIVALGEYTPQQVAEWINNAKWVDVLVYSDRGSAGILHQIMTMFALIVSIHRASRGV